MKSAPDYIQFYPTLRCDRSCDFCFNRSMPRVPDMPRDRMKALLGRLGQLGVGTIDIIGGEPTLHGDIVPFLREAAARGFHLNISSNGSNRERLEEIAALGDRVTIGISINDRETLRALRDYIRVHRPVVKTVYQRDLDAGMIDEILSLPVKQFYLIYRDALDREELPAAVPFHRYFSAVNRTYGDRSVGMVYCSGFLPDQPSHPELATVRCPAGTTKLGVMPDGSVYPCNLFFGRKEFFLGNILSDPFEVIWRNPALSFFRSFDRNTCPVTTCPLHAACHGGCPAHGLMHEGSLAAPEPRCRATGREDLV